MRILKIEEASPYLKQAVRFAMQSKCKNIKEGAVILDQCGNVVAGGSRILQSSSGLRLCRGECVMKENVFRCPAQHATWMAIGAAFAGGHSLRGLTLCRVIIKEDHFSIPENVCCCNRCKEAVLIHGINMLLWNSSSKEKGCVIYSNDELQEGVHVRLSPGIANNGNFFPVFGN